MLKISEPSSVSWRPTVAGSHYAVSTGHYLASIAATRILASGGNAIDAGVCAAMALAVLQPDVVSFAGVAPTLIYLKKEHRVISLAGLGYWPAATDIEKLISQGGDAIPEGILRQIIPAAPATHIAALKLYGTLSFEQAVTPALELARDGFYMYPELRDSIELHGAEIDRYPENATIYRPGGKTPAVGTRLIQRNLARTIQRMVDAERKQTGSRDAKLQAVHDIFYKGDIAAEIDSFHRRMDGFIRLKDLEQFEVPIEEGISCNYQDYQVHTCDTWCQGIVLLEALKILEGIDLRLLGHNSTAYLHVLAEALNLAFSDRESYVGDPKFVEVPTDSLLSNVYALQQRKRINRNEAFGAMPEQGSLTGLKGWNDSSLTAGLGDVAMPPDTIYACVVDAEGNAYSATPSDTMYDSPMVDGLGLSISTRGMQARLQAGHPCVVAPGKRPRLTPTPAIALKDGEFAMAWGTPGGDVQCSSMLQVFLNIVHFDMQVQQAIEAPRIATFNFPNSFSPNTYLPGRLCIEQSVPLKIIEELRRLGHDVEVWRERSWKAGAICAITRDFESQFLRAGADPRRAAYALAW